MTRGVERRELEAELASVTRMLARLSPSRILERRGFEARRDRLQAELLRLQQSPARNAEVALFFSGAPVVGQKGARADFAGPAMGHFSSLVAAKAASAPADAHASHTASSIRALHVTGTVHGSFGFVLEELERPLVGDSDLTGAVKETIQLLARLPELVSSNEVLGGESKAAHDALLAFLKVLRDRSASVRVVGDDQEVEVDQSLATAAADLLAATSVEEEIVIRLGTFGGSLDYSGRFEFFDEEIKQLISGRLAPEVAAESLDHWHHRRCKARLHVVTTKRGPKTSVKHTLLGLSEPE